MPELKIENYLCYNQQGCCVGMWHRKPLEEKDNSFADLWALVRFAGWNEARLMSL